MSPKLSSATKAKQDHKAFLMKQILDNKEALFGRFGAPEGPNTKEKQREKWAEIRDNAIKNGYVELQGKTADDVRFKVFSVFKTRTIQKVDLLKESGQGGDRLSEVSFLLWGKILELL
uniref:Regulatory protein zeste n=1 Tax=Acrobeloides nanus TaxID=290746 RepID=A0A914CTD8_9BILA